MYVVPGRYGANTWAVTGPLAWAHSPGPSLPCSCRQATLRLGFDGAAQPTGDTVAVTMLAPETWTTCGADSV